MNRLLQDMLRDREARRKKQKILTQMYDDQTQYLGTWKLLSEFINPYRGRFSEDSRDEGRRRDYKLLDPYPMQAHRKCAAGLHSGLTSPSRPWFELSLHDTELAEFHTAKRWLDECQEIMMGIYARSNVYNMLQQVEAELTQFGTAAALMLQDYDTAIRARTYTCGEYVGGVDAQGRVVRFGHKFKLNAVQMVDAFGYDVCTAAVQEAYHNDNLSTLFEVDMLIEKNPRYDPDGLALGNFPWRSTYWQPEADDKFLRVSGFHECPFLMPRWNMIANSIYGYGPGHDALGDCMQIQKMEKMKLRLLEHDANPPLQVPSGVASVSRIPGSQTEVPMTSMGQIQPLFSTKGNVQEIVGAIGEKRQLIGQAFYNDLFVMISSTDNPQMTAREVAERHEEKLLMLSPALEQMHNEVLAPLTRRNFEIGLRNGLFPPMPEELKGQESNIKVDFVSLLAQAQKMVASPAIERTVAFAGNLSGPVPEILDNIDMDAVLREHARLNGAPEIILRSEEEVKEIRAQRQQQQQQQQQMAQAAAMAGPLKDGVEAARLLSETPVNQGDSLLDMINRSGGI